MTPRERDLADLHWRIEGISDDAVQFDGATFPKTFKAVLHHPTWPMRARLTVTVHPERGPIATGLEATQPVEPSELVSFSEMHDLLKKVIDMSTLLREVTAYAVGEKVRLHLLLGLPGNFGDADREPELQRISAIGTAVRDRAYLNAAPRRRHLLTDTHLRTVAEVYRAALAEGHPPTQAIAEKYQITHSTASKWVRKARDAGSLGAALGTQPGEEIQ
jgi:hypothetical protein